jgi:hypothetical protein
MDKKIKDKKQKIEFVLDLDDPESIKIAIIKARVKYNFSLIQSLFFLARIIEAEAKEDFSNEELEKASYYILEKSGIYNET